MSPPKSQLDPDLLCWDCGVSNKPNARECWLCHRRDWRWPGLQSTTTTPGSSTIPAKLTTPRPATTPPRTNIPPRTTTPPMRDPPSTIPGWMVSLALMVVLAGILGLAPGLGVIGLFVVLVVWADMNRDRRRRRDEPVSKMKTARPGVREQAIAPSRQNEPTSGLLTVLSVVGLTFMMLTVVFVSALFTAFLALCGGAGRGSVSPGLMLVAIFAFFVILLMAPLFRRS